MRWIEVEEDLPKHGFLVVIYDNESESYSLAKWSAARGWTSNSGGYKFEHISHYLDGSEALFTMHSIKLEHKVKEEEEVEKEE